MASPTRTSSSLANRSIVARIAALVALAVAGVAIYLVVMNFTASESTEEPRNDKKGRSAQRA